jgi:phospholipid transport system substrate-binding protein
MSGRLQWDRCTRRSVLIGAGAAVSSLLVCGTALPAQADDASRFVTEVGKETLAAARQGSTEAFRSVIRRYGDLPGIALFSLGQYRRMLPPGRQQEYYRLVEAFIAKTLANNAPKLRGTSIAVDRVRELEGYVEVESTIELVNRSANVSWRLRPAGGAYRVFDVRVEGIWLTITQRSVFTDVIRNGGGKIDALFNYLKG